MSERPLVLALDQGTTSSRAMLFDRRGNVVAVAQREHRQIFPRPGWVEHDADEIWRAQIGVAEEALRRADVGAADVAAVGIANQRETTILWDRTTLRPLHNAIVWQDRRTAAAIEAIEKAGYARTIRDKTGLIPDAYFSASKIAWLLDNVPGARRRAASGELAAGTIDSWLIAKLTNGSLHATDASNASRTMLYDIHSGSWDEDLLAIFDVPKALLPAVVASRGVIAEIDVDSTLRGLPLAGVVGDQQAALAGQLCHRPGLAKNSYGTGCFLLVNTGSQAVASRHQMLTTVAWQAEGALTYALEGSVFIGGAVVQWLRDGLGIIRSAREVEALARSVPDNGGVFLVPAFAGLGAPYWDPHARGTICGITGGTTAGHLARAALEAIALQVADLADAMAADCELPVAELRVDGGAAGNDLLLQIQADLLGVPISRPQVTETTALGAALMAGLGVGLWRDAGELEAARRIDRRFEPTASPGSVALLRERWAEALRRACDWETSTAG